MDLVSLIPQERWNFSSGYCQIGQEYGQRRKVETVNSVIERKFRGSIRSCDKRLKRGGGLCSEIGLQFSWVIFL